MSTGIAELLPGAKPRRVPRKKAPAKAAKKARKPKASTVTVEVTDTGVMVNDAPVHTHRRATDPVPVEKPAAKASKKAPAKKARPAAKKKAAATVAAEPVKVPKKATKKAAAKKAATKKTAAKGTAKSARGFRRELNVHGFVPGSDSALIVDALIDGGKDRHDATAKAVKKIEKSSGMSTRGGGQKNVPSLISGLMARLTERGYKIESEWRLKPPASVTKKMEAEAAKKEKTKAK